MNRMTLCKMADNGMIFYFGLYISIQKKKKGRLALLHSS